MADSPHRLWIIGYWEGPDERADGSRGWPDPHDLVGSWDPDDRAATVRHLNSGREFRAFSGTSACRICGVKLGWTERTDGTWAWPDRLEHYVEAHDVLLPDEFVSACRGSDSPPAWLEQHQLEHWVEGGSGQFPMLGQKQSELHVDDTRWLDWAAARTPARPAAQPIVRLLWVKSPDAEMAQRGDPGQAPEGAAGSRVGRLRGGRPSVSGPSAGRHRLALVACE